MNLFLAILVAQAQPILNNPAPQTGSIGSPVTVNDCSLWYVQRGLVKTVVGLKIEFTNESSKTADLVTFATTSGIGSATIRDVGSYQPGAEVTHKFRQFSWTREWAFDNPNLHCSVQAVHFTDGTVWQNGVAPAATQTVASILGLALANQASGVYVQFVAPGSPGDTAGIRQNDRIVSIGGNAISVIQDIKTILGMTRDGTIVPLVIERDGTTVNVRIKAGRAVPSSP